MKIWHILFAAGIALTVGTVGAADMGAISTAQIVLQILLGIGLMISAYATFIAACNSYYKKKWRR